MLSGGSLRVFVKLRRKPKADPMANPHSRGVCGEEWWIAEELWRMSRTRPKHEFIFAVARMHAMTLRTRERKFVKVYKRRSVDV